MGGSRSTRPDRRNSLRNLPRGLRKDRSARRCEVSKRQKRQSKTELGSASTDRSGILCRAAFAVALLYCAAAVNFSPWIQSFHQADTLLRAVMSTLRWTPFYWTENRLGNLAPLLAIGIRNPLPNLLLQTQIHVLACLLCVWLIVGLCAARGRAFAAESLVCTQIIWLLAAAGVRLNWQSVPSFFLGEPYALSMALLLAALFLVLRDVRLPHGIQHALIVLLSFLAFWVYIPQCRAGDGSAVDFPWRQDEYPLAVDCARGSSVRLRGGVSVGANVPGSKFSRSRRSPADPACNNAALVGRIVLHSERFPIVLDWRLRMHSRRCPVPPG